MELQTANWERSGACKEDGAGSEGERIQICWTTRAVAGAGGAAEGCEGGEAWDETCGEACVEEACGEGVAIIR